MKLENLIERLDKIAKKYGDEFKYQIDIENLANGLCYTFVCKFMCEDTYGKVEGNTFFYGDGKTIDDAIEAANNNVENACKKFKYVE